MPKQAHRAIAECGTRAPVLGDSSAGSRTASVSIGDRIGRYTAAFPGRLHGRLQTLNPNP
eukprot:1171427-Rhodomonas_salina.2